MVQSPAHVEHHIWTTYGAVPGRARGKEPFQRAPEQRCYGASGEVGLAPVTASIHSHDVDGILTNFV
jgi:hypothetical protein